MPPTAEAPALVLAVVPPVVVAVVAVVASVLLPRPDVPPVDLFPPVGELVDALVPPVALLPPCGDELPPCSVDVSLGVVLVPAVVLAWLLPPVAPDADLEDDPEQAQMLSGAAASIANSAIEEVP